jgi:tryptophanase
MEQKVSVAELRARVLEVLAGHVGKEKAIGMGELFEAVYGRPWRHRINDTRPLRHLISDLRQRGIPICSIQGGDGYYLPATESELLDYTARDKMRALRILARVARMHKISLPRLIGQINMELSDDAA